MALKRNFLGQLGLGSADPDVPDRAVRIYDRAADRWDDRPIVTADISDYSPGGGSGTVTSVALAAPAIFAVSGSPVTTSGTLMLTLATQARNLVWAGPATGADAAPTFRALAAADVPDLSGTYLTVSAAASTYLTISNAASTYLTISNAASTYQPLDGDLTAIAALSSTGLLKRTGPNTWAFAAEGTDYLSGASAKLPVDVGFSVASSSALATGTDLKRRPPLAFDAVAYHLAIVTDNAPSGGSFTASVVRVGDGATIATLSVTSGNRSASTTTMTTPALAAGDVLRLDLSAVNGVTGFTLVLTILSKNQ